MTIRPLFIGLYDTGLLGIRYLSASLKKFNYDSHIIFLKTFNSYAANEPTQIEYNLLQQTIKEIQPSYIGISIMSSFYLSVVEQIVKDIRLNFPDMTIIIGGVYATLFPEECLKLADVVFRGECEEAIVEFTEIFESITTGVDLKSTNLIPETNEVVLKTTDLVSESTTDKRPTNNNMHPSVLRDAQGRIPYSHTNLEIPKTTNLVPESTEVVLKTTDLVSESTTDKRPTNNNMHPSVLRDAQGRVPYSHTNLEIPKTTNLVPESNEVDLKTTNLVPETNEVVLKSTDLIPETTNLIPETTTDKPNTITITNTNTIKERGDENHLSCKHDTKTTTPPINVEVFGDLDNIVIQTPDGIQINPMRDLKKEISNIPHPDFGGDNIYYINNNQVSKGDPRAKTHSYELRTSRGCPNRCSYCSSSSIRDLYKGKGPFIRQRDVDDVIQELTSVKQQNQGLQLLRFWDDIFPWNKDWVLKFSIEYKKHIALPFEIWGHPRLSGNIECLKALVEAGLSKIVVGIQSGCPNIRKNIYTRHETQEEILNCSRAITEAKVPIVIYDFILGHPFETVEDLKTTLELCRNISKPFKLQLHGLSFLPGTPIEQIAIDHGVKTREEILKEHKQSLREQYHQNHWWRQGHGQKQDNEKSYWYTLIYLTQFSTGEYVIRYALKNERLKQNPRRLIVIQRLYNFRLTLQMGFRKLGFLVRRKLRL